jgi:hypothetical protein
MTRTSLAAIFAFTAANLCTPVLAEEAAPAEERSVKKTFKRIGRDIGGAGKQLGKEFAEFGKGVGRGTSNAAKANAGKISSDVKQGNFKPTNNTDAMKRRDQTEVGGAAVRPPAAEGGAVKSSGGTTAQPAKP